MAKTDIMGLLTGGLSQATNPMTAGTYRERMLARGAKRAEQLGGAVRSMLNTGPTIQEKIATAAGQQQKQRRNAFADYMEKTFPNSGVRELVETGVVTPDNFRDFFGSANAQLRQGSRYTVRDAEGNLFAMTTKFDNSTGSFDTVYAPIGDSPAKPTGKVEILTKEGITFQEKEIMGIGIKGQTEKEKKYQALRTKTIDMLPSLSASKDNLERAETLLNSVETGGPINVAATGLESFFGVKSADKAELEIILGQEMYKSLKPLFGGVISEGERQAIEAIYANLRKGNIANKGILKRLKQELDDAIIKSTLYLNSDTSEDFDRVLKQMFPETPKKIIKFEDL